MKIAKIASLGMLALLIACHGRIHGEQSMEKKWLASASIAGAPNQAKTSSANPYNLNTENQFEVAYTYEIEPYWKRYGVEGEFFGVDGIKIKYMTFIRKDEKGAIVISSGRTEGYFKYHELVYDLGKQGYSVYIHDHRGQGYSGRMTKNQQLGHVNRFDEYVDDLKYFVDHVVKKIPHRKLFLLAHSMGGGIATLYIEKYPNDFDAAALSSPMHEPGSRLIFVNEGCGLVRTIAWSREHILKIKEPRYVPGKGNYERMDCGKSDLTHSKVRCEKTADLYEQSPDTKLGGPSTHWAAEACKAAERLKKGASNIRVPVLVLQAEKDTAVAPEGQDEFCRNLQSSGQRQCHGAAPQVIKGAYHELFVEQDEFRIPALTIILDFYREQINGDP